MANIFTNSPATLDFEEGNLNDADSSYSGDGGTIAASSTQAYAGTYSCRATADSDGSEAGILKQINYPAGNLIYMRWYVYIASKGTSTITALTTVCFGLSRYTNTRIYATHNMMFGIVKRSDGSLVIRYADAVAGDNEWDTGVDLSTGQWYEIEFKYDNSGANLELSVWVDGTEYTHTGSGNGPTWSGYLRAAANASASVANANLDVYYDSIQCEDTRIGGGASTASATFAAAASLSAQSKSLATASVSAAASLSAQSKSLATAALAAAATCTATLAFSKATVTAMAAAALSCSRTIREITPTLLAAALSWKGTPAVTLEVKDTRNRWTVLHYSDDSTQWTDQAADGTDIHRVTSDSSGSIRWCIVTDPATQSQWTAWETIVSTAIPSSEVAIAIYSTDNLHVYYLKEGAGDTWDIRCKPYVNATWQNTTLIVAGIDGAKAGDPPEPPRIAACNGYLFYTDTGLVKAIAVPVGGQNPGTPVTWTQLGTLEVRNGIGAAYHATNDECLVAVAGAGNLSVGTYDADSGAWDGGPVQIAPGGSGTAAADCALQNPSVEIAGDVYLLTYLDTFDATFAEWEQPILLQSTDWTHFGNELALGLGATTHRRASLAHVSSTRTTYAANQESVLSSTQYHTCDSTKHLKDLAVAAYSRDTIPGRSSLRVELLNPDGVYDDVGRANAYAEAIKPLSSIIVRRGYHTSLGQETMRLDPHYITRATVQKGHGYRHLVVEAVDGWGLLRLWRPNETLTWTNKSISWLMDEIAARVDLTIQDNASTYTAYQIPTFTVTPSRDGSQALSDLLRLAGCVGYFDSAGTLQVNNLYSWSPAYEDIGDADEILRGEYAAQPYVATSFRVFGDDAAAAGETSWNSMELGLRINQNVEDLRITTDAQAQTVRLYLYTIGRTSHRREVASFPTRPDLYLWQRVRLFPPGDVIPPSDCIRRIVRLGESLDGPRSRYLTTIATTYT